MPMGVVSDDDLNSELNRSQVQIIDRERPGRKEGDNNVPDALRKIISDTAITEGRKEAIALSNMFGISNSSVSAYTRGATTTDAPINSNKSLAEHNTKVKNNIQSKAQSKILLALDQIDENTIGNCGAVEASQVAKNLAGIIKDFNPDIFANERASFQQQLVIYAPFVRREDEFPVINALNE